MTTKVIKTVCLYLTPIILIIWAIILATAGNIPTTAGLLSVASSIIIQIRTIHAKYRNEKNKKGNHA